MSKSHASVMIRKVKAFFGIAYVARRLGMTSPSLARKDRHTIIVKDKGK